MVVGPMIDMGLATTLYRSISDDNEIREFKNWHASSMAECPRSHYFKRIGIKAISTPTAAKMLRWKAGHLIEEVIRPHLLKVYPDLQSNVRLRSKKLDLTGEFDNYSPKEKTLIEVKSVHVFAPKMIEKEGKPYLSHEYQNHTYKILMAAPDAEILEDKEKDVWDKVLKPLSVEKVVYIYIALDGRIIALDTDIQQSILDNLLKRLEVLKEGLAGTMPPCFCKEGHPLWKSTMQYCDYRNESTKECCSEELSNEQI